MRKDDAMSHKVVLNTANLNHEKRVREYFIRENEHLIQDVAKKEKRFTELLNAKAEKTALIVLAKSNRSLSSLPDKERQIELAIIKNILLDKILNFLERV